MNSTDEVFVNGIAEGLVKLTKQIPFVGDITSELIGPDMKGFVYGFFHMEMTPKKETPEEKSEKIFLELKEISQKVNRITTYLKDLEKEIDILQSDVNMQLLNQILSDNTHKIVTFSRNVENLSKKAANKEEYEKYYKELMEGEFGQQGMNMVSTTISFAANALGNGVSKDLFEIYQRPVKRKYLWEHEAYPECTEFESYVFGIYYLSAIVSFSFLDYKLKQELSEADRDTLESELEFLIKATNDMSNRQQDLINKRYKYPFRFLQYDYKKGILINGGRVRTLDSRSEINESERQELMGGMMGPIINMNLSMPNNDAFSSITEEMIEEIKSKKKGKSLREVFKEAGIESSGKIMLINNSLREDAPKAGQNGFQYIKVAKVCNMDDKQLQLTDKVIGYSYLGTASMSPIPNVITEKVFVVKSTDSGYGEIPDWLARALPENISDGTAQWWYRTFPEGFPDWWKNCFQERIPEELLETLPQFMAPGITEDLKNYLTQGEM